MALGNDGHLLESVQKVCAFFKSHRKALEIVVFCIIYNSMNILYLLSKKQWKSTLILGPQNSKVC